MNDEPCICVENVYEDEEKIVWGHLKGNENDRKEIKKGDPPVEFDGISIVLWVEKNGIKLDPDGIRFFNLDIVWSPAISPDEAPLTAKYKRSDKKIVMQLKNNKIGDGKGGKFHPTTVNVQVGGDFG